jgi:hypothetical protein
MSQYLYNPQELMGREEPYKARFDQLHNLFGHFCKVFVTDKDGFGRIMGAKVAKVDPKTNLEISSVKIQFSGVEPLDREIIDAIHSRLSWNGTADLGSC